MKCDNVCASKTGKRERTMRERSRQQRGKEKEWEREAEWAWRKEESFEAKHSQNKANVSGSFCFYLSEHDILPLSFSNTFLSLPGLKTEIITVCACFRLTDTLVCSIPEMPPNHLLEMHLCAIKFIYSLGETPPPAPQKTGAANFYINLQYSLTGRWNSTYNY